MTTFILCLLNSGNAYVYPVLDWEDNPTEAVITVVMGTAILPCIHIAFWCITLLRDWIHKKLYMTSKWNTSTGEVNNGFHISIWYQPFCVLWIFKIHFTHFWQYNIYQILITVFETWKKEMNYENRMSNSHHYLKFSFSSNHWIGSHNFACSNIF